MLSPADPQQKSGRNYTRGSHVTATLPRERPGINENGAEVPNGPPLRHVLGTASGIAQATGASSNVLAVLFAPCAMAGLQKRTPIS